MSLDPQVSTEPRCPSRRRVLCGLAGAGGLTLALAACSSGDSGSAGSGNGDSGGTVPTSDVPVGKAVVMQVGDQQVVLAQPSAGDYVGFSAVCTHQGGIVVASRNLVVQCPLHGSQFDAGADGAVLQGPATRPCPK